jgi:hypothetical protein
MKCMPRQATCPRATGFFSVPVLLDWNSLNGDPAASHGCHARRRVTIARIAETQCAGMAVRPLVAQGVFGDQDALHVRRSFSIEIEIRIAVEPGDARFAGKPVAAEKLLGLVRGVLRRERGVVLRN